MKTILNEKELSSYITEFLSAYDAGTSTAKYLIAEHIGQTLLDSKLIDVISKDGEAGSAKPGEIFSVYRQGDFQPGRSMIHYSIIGQTAIRALKNGESFATVFGTVWIG
jgi:hypothetical protein